MDRQQENSYYEYLALLLKMNKLTGSVADIAKKVITSHEISLTTSERSIYQTEIVEKYTCRECSCCGQPVPRLELLFALEHDGCCLNCNKAPKQKVLHTDPTHRKQKFNTKTFLPWMNEGLKRISIIAVVFYSTFMFAPFDGWPNSRIRHTVEMRHCIGWEKFPDKTVLSQGASLLDYVNNSLQTKDSALYRHLNNHYIADKMWKYYSPNHWVLESLDSNYLIYDQNDNKLHLTTTYYSTYSHFQTQLKFLRWGWLFLNYIFWPLALVIVIEVIFWIKCGFSKEQS